LPQAVLPVPRIIRGDPKEDVEMSLWEEVKKNVVDIYSVTSDKTTEIAKVGTRRWDKFGISRDIERQFSELGNLVYTGIKDGKDQILEDPAVSVLMSRIEALEQELKKKEAEIEDIQKEHRERKAAEAAAGGAAAAGGFEAADSEDAPVEDQEAQDEAPEVLIKNPALEEGTDESAILVEPVEDAPIEGESPRD
jgi:ribosomal protein L12E/L44/L45/RPP1/RPP2